MPARGVLGPMVFLADLFNKDDYVYEANYYNIPVLGCWMLARSVHPSIFPSVIISIKHYLYCGLILF